MEADADAELEPVVDVKLTGPAPNEGVTADPSRAELPTAVWQNTEARRELLVGRGVDSVGGALGVIGVVPACVEEACGRNRFGDEARGDEGCETMAARSVSWPVQSAGDQVLGASARDG